MLYMLMQVPRSCHIYSKVFSKFEMSFLLNLDEEWWDCFHFLTGSSTGLYNCEINMGQEHTIH